MDFHEPLRVLCCLYIPHLSLKAVTTVYGSVALCAKLAHLGLIEHVTWMNSRYGGQQGWKLSNRMSGGLRRMADKLDAWRKDTRPERREKDERLVGLLR